MNINIVLKAELENDFYISECCFAYPAGELDNVNGGIRWPIWLLWPVLRQLHIRPRRYGRTIRH